MPASFKTIIGRLMYFDIDFYLEFCRDGSHYVYNENDKSDIVWEIDVRPERNYLILYLNDNLYKQYHIDTITDEQIDEFIHDILKHLLHH